MHGRGFSEARLYGDPGGIGATNGVQSLYSFFLLMDNPNVYNLPEAPTLPARNIVPGLVGNLVGGVFLVGAAAFALWKGGRGRR
jgi:formate dehydrogenase iron-sulfur subunit